MTCNELTINAEEFRNLIGVRPFLALPQEEIDRLYASTELVSVPSEQAENDSSILQIMIYPVIHFNYSWATFTPNTNSRNTTHRLGAYLSVQPEQESILFLDEQLNKEAESTVRKHLQFTSGYTCRLAGILYDESTVFGRTHPAFVYMFRLHQAEEIKITDNHNSLSWCGTGELQLNKHRYDSAGGIIIDHITAF